MDVHAELKVASIAHQTKCTNAASWASGTVKQDLLRTTLSPSVCTIAFVKTEAIKLFHLLPKPH